MSETGITTNKRIRPDTLKNFCVQAMRKRGLSEPDARVAAEVLVTTDQMGVHSHGVVSLRRYLQRIEKGGLVAQAPIQVLQEGPGWVCLDGKGVMGMVSCYRAMERAIEKARSAGIGYAVLRNGSHCGALGYYASMAMKQDMFGLAMSGCTPIMAVPGGKGPIMGNSPLAYAVPAGKEKPILLDMALSKVAAGKIVAAHKMGKDIPDDWYVDADGLPTTNSGLYPHIGAMLPMAGHKGYGLALMVDILTSVLSGGGMLQQVRPWLLGDPAVPENLSQSMIAIDINAIMPIDRFKERMDTLIREIKNAPKAKGSDRIYLPGEMEWEKLEYNRKHGILLPEDVVMNVKGMAEDVGLPIDEWLV
jgi:ureidoglycolate dehydrogenase (NAD+)